MTLQHGSTARRVLAVVVGLLILTAVGVGASARHAGAGAGPGTRMSPVEAPPAGGTDLAYEMGRGTLSAKTALNRPAVDVSVMSFNLCGGVCHRGEVKRTANYTARIATERKASVVLLQELCYGQYLRVRSLLAAKGFTGTFAQSVQSGGCAVRDPDHHKGFGVAVLVRGTFFGRVVKPLPTPAGFEKRLLLGVTAKVGGRSTFVAVVHLAPSPAAGRQSQLATLTAYLQPKASRPLIVGGDFNCLPDDPGLNGLYSAKAGGRGRFIEADETRQGVAARSGASTYDLADRKIDYVFFSSGSFRYPRASSLFTTMSDHHIYIGTARTTAG